eukprot:TRINITY_DN14191_c0_g1_i1.p1 TRINITY_DN14191_c0_g1~~TRINITY_DN14191_c0_g1_i1.p1  ORF type:complete len:52 (-),score=6.91 TRINITY_DN14191_c0_g1_i1:102-257(-)
MPSPDSILPELSVPEEKCHNFRSLGDFGSVVDGNVIIIEYFEIKFQFQSCS